MATEQDQIIARDGAHQSPWQSGLTSIKSTAVVHPETVYDVLIIGGGITGMTAALMLQNTGKQCLLVEAQTIGFGTTGGTSAHINTFADTTYSEAQSAFGKEG
ncbi:MAG: dependent oxidoreductase, partial [Mucilaginibacter sp.]|nr:dependent oxidoreductase [Mucilaginibacter sp.]